MKKALAVVMIIILVLSLALTALGRLNPFIFWLIAVVSAAFAYFILPKMNS